MTTFPELREAQRLYTHQLLDYEGKPNGVHLGVNDLEVCKQAHDEGHTSKEIHAWVDAAAYDAQAAEIERLRGLMRAVLDTRDAEAKAQRAFQNALDNYSGEHRSYGIAHTKAMCAASDAEKAARAALEQTK